MIAAFVCQALNRKERERGEEGPRSFRDSLRMRQTLWHGRKVGWASAVPLCSSGSGGSGCLPKGWLRFSAYFSTCDRWQGSLASNMSEIKWYGWTPGEPSDLVTRTDSLCRMIEVCYWFTSIFLLIALTVVKVQMSHCYCILSPFLLNWNSHENPAPLPSFVLSHHSLCQYLPSEVSKLFSRLSLSLSQSIAFCTLLSVSLTPL